MYHGPELIDQLLLEDCDLKQRFITPSEKAYGTKRGTDWPKDTQLITNGSSDP